jgi:cobalt-zinc-cadmium efflux system outer membrane protein
MPGVPVRRTYGARCVAAALIAAAAAPRVVAAQQPVTRAQAEAAAIARGPLVALAAADTAGARAALIMAREFENPVVSASYSKDPPQYHATVDLLLDFPWLRSARIRAATEASRSAVLTFRFQRASARFDADVAYTQALGAAAHARLTRRNAAAADSLLRMARVRRDAGDASELDVQLAVVNAGQMANAAAQDSVSAVTALLEVQRAMGLAADTVSIALADTLALPVTDAAPAAATALQVAAAEAALRSADAALALAHRSVLLSPSLTAGFDTHDPTQRGLLPAIGISIPLPLFNFNGGQIAAAAAERQRARAALDVTRRESDAALARARRDLAVAVEKARRDQGLVASAERVAAMSLTAYAEGAVALPSVLEAQRQARDALGTLIDDLAAASAADAALRLFSSSEASP